MKNLEGKQIEIEGQTYELSKQSALWGSLMVGIMPNMRSSLEWSDLLMQKLYKIIPAHTIEPFSLSESLLRNYNLVEGKKFVSLYSTSRKKKYARNILINFFEENRFLNLDEKVLLTQHIKIKRPLYIIFVQRFMRIFNK